MRLVADASALVGEVLRERGRRLIAHPDLVLFVPEAVLDETTHEVEKRLDRMVHQGRIGVETAKELVLATHGLIDAYVSVIPETVFDRWEIAARARVPADPSDWPTVAAAIALGAAIWTNDRDFLGCGCVTWTTDTLLLELGLI